MAKNKPAELKSKLLTEAEELLDNYINAALGKEALMSVDGGAREAIWELLTRYMTEADEHIQIPDGLRGTPEGVLTAVEQGMITIEEGERLLKMHLTIANINNAGNPDQLNQTLIPSLTINTSQPVLPGNNSKEDD